MKEYALLLLCLADVTPRCGSRGRPAERPIVRGTAASPRAVDVTVSNQGYTPATVHGLPGESLRLIFHYQHSAGECGRELLVPAQNLKLTLNEEQPAEVPLTLPNQPGEVPWSCGMEMLHGKVVVD
jgi:Cu+-exporting ATPase